MSGIVLVTESSEAPNWLAGLRAAAGRRSVAQWPDGMDAAYACAWRPPIGVLRSMPNLRVVFSLGAGVDHLLSDPTLPDAPVVRIVHPDLTMRMTEYVVLHVLMHHRRQRLYDRQQAERVWRNAPQPGADEVCVGILGLGVIGRHVASALRTLGFQVSGWSRTPHGVTGVTTYAGLSMLEPFLRGCEILVCLLPHTPQTEGMLNYDLLTRLKRDGALGGAFLINAGRGRTQINEDILRALDDGALAGATLDVFPQEPLPPDDPLWRHPNVTITPHNAGDISPALLGRYVVEQIARYEAGLPLDNVVDRVRGY